MIRFLIWLLALLVSAIGLAVVARYNLGNVVLFYPPYRVDISLNFFLLLISVLFVLLYIVIRAIRATQKMPGKVAVYRREKREKDAHNALHGAIKSLFEGRFGHAEKSATRAANLSEDIGLAALIGAHAAHRLRQPHRRDDWLAMMEQESSYKIAKLMTTIELLVDDHQSEQALDVVKELNASGARHIHALRLALKANQQAGNWPEVLRLVYSLDKHHALHPVLSTRLKELAYEQVLSHLALDKEKVRTFWSGMTASDKKNPFIVVLVARAFHKNNAQDMARSILEKALDAAWDERLIGAYRALIADEGSAALLTQIECCEQWMKQNAKQAGLLLALGTFCLQQKLWGKAQNYLEQLISDTDSENELSEAHFQLARLYEALEKNELAAVHYRACARIIKKECYESE